MDFFRKILGFPEKRSDSDGNPFRNPSWEEIMGNRNRMEPPQTHQPGIFEEFYGSATPEDSFMSVFGQMDNMFEQLDAMMQGLQQHPGEFVLIEDPELHNPSPRHTPRDFMLKEPDSELPAEAIRPQERIMEGDSHEGHDPWGPHGFGGGFGGFGGIHGGMHGGMHGGHNPFQMMEEFFHNFGKHFGGIPYEGSPFDGPQGPPMIQGPDMGPSNRDSMLKEDSDLDDRVSGGLSQLLKEGPSYGSLNPPMGNSPLRLPDGEQPQPGVTRSFHSSSITRIRRPDGSIEETRKYRDSSGREEVTVTHTQPETSDNPGSLLKPEEAEKMDGSFSSGTSLFSRLFTR